MRCDHMCRAKINNTASLFDTYSLCTKWFRRSCVMSSCQLFLMPVAEGGAAVGMEPTPPASFIRLTETQRESSKWLLKNTHMSYSHVELPRFLFVFKCICVPSYPWLFTLRCIMVSCSRLACWLWGGAPTPPFTPIGFTPTPHGKEKKLYLYSLSYPNNSDAVHMPFSVHVPQHVTQLYSIKHVLEMLVLQSDIWQTFLYSSFHYSRWQ